MLMFKEVVDLMEVLFKFSNHAEERMYQRGFEVVDITSMIQSAGEELLERKDGDKVNIIDGNCTVTVGVNIDEEYTINFDVVTVINERYINKNYNNIILN